MLELTDFHLRTLGFDGLTRDKGIMEEFMFCPSWIAHRWLIIKNIYSKGNHGQPRFLKTSAAVTQGVPDKA